MIVISFGSTRPGAAVKKKAKKKTRVAGEEFQELEGRAKFSSLWAVPVQECYCCTDKAGGWWGSALQQFWVHVEAVEHMSKWKKYVIILNYAAMPL